MYEDFIIRLVGEFGLQALKESNLIETCGVINGRQLYVICDKKGEWMKKPENSCNQLQFKVEM